MNEAFWSMLPKEDIFMVRDFNTQNRAVSPLTETLSNPNITLTRGKVTYIEVHGYTPSLVDFPAVSIRDNIRLNNGNVFIFTTLRDPIDTARSLRNYMCDNHKLKFRKACSNITHFEKYFPNTQLNYILGRSVPFPRARHPMMAITHENHLKAVASLDSIDYVGSLETLPLTLCAVKSFLDRVSPDFNSTRLDAIPHVNAQRKKAAVLPVTARLIESQRDDMLMYSHFFNHTRCNDSVIAASGSRSRHLLHLSSSSEQITTSGYSAVASGGGDDIEWAVSIVRVDLLVIMLLVIAMSSYYRHFYNRSCEATKPSTSIRLVSTN